ncbi:MAG: pyruvate kinase [Ignavibacteriales bacterium]
MTNIKTTDTSNSHSSSDKGRLGERLMALYSGIVREVEKNKCIYPLKNQHQNEVSRDNLLAYLALRRHNLEDLQMELAEKGLSSLGRLEGQVLITIEQVLKHFKEQLNSDMRNEIFSTLKKINHQESRNITTKRSRLLLGRPRKGRSTRIMVTLDLESIHQPHMLEELLVHGMDIARINCAHETPTEWKMMVDAIRHAEERLIQRGQGIGRRCRIVMDLAGPKIRTGSTGLEIRPLKIAVPKDIHGRTLRMIEGFLDGEAQFTERVSLSGVPPSFVVSIKKGSEELPNLDIGERLSFYDSRGRHRSFTILERISPKRVKIGLEKTAYVQEGIVLHRQRYKKNFNTDPRNRNKDRTHSELEFDTTDGLVGQNLNPVQHESRNGGINEQNDKNVTSLLTIGPVSPQPTDVLVKSGDIVLLSKKKAALGFNSFPFSKYEKNIAGEVSCNLPEVLNSVEVGHRVYIDDGKIGAITRSSTEEHLELEILSPSDTTAKIKPEKGLNFPDSNLNVPALTSKDIDNLEFIVNNATAVGLSFVYSSNDIVNLYEALLNIEKVDFGIIAKIETSCAVDNLAKILLAGLDLPNFGILIARGDLAVEMGFENLPAIQEDILCMCEAAHVPVILATQVLETMAKSGLPTRAEMIDAAFGQRAECVMLNKGKHILEAVKMLSLILGSEEKRHLKKRQIFGEFIKQSGFD